MKKILVGGFLTLSGTIGLSAVLLSAALRPASAWVTPPGWLVCTVLENGGLIPALGFGLFLAAGLFIMLINYKSQNCSKEFCKGIGQPDAGHSSPKGQQESQGNN